MRIAFINPPVYPYRKVMRNFDCATESKANYLYQPYDFLLLSARLPEACQFEMWDAVAHKWSSEFLMEKVNSFQPEIVVLAMANTCWEEDFEFLKELHKQINNTGKIFAFGDLFFEPSFREKVFKYCDGFLEDPVKVDFNALINSGNGEFKKRAPLKTTKKPENFKLSLPRHEMFMHNRYRWPFARHLNYTTVFTAWGCPYSCDYCIVGQFPNLWRSFEEVLSELHYVHKLGIKEIYIGDRSFGLPLNNVMSLLDGMISSGFDFSWSTYFHPNQYHPELLEKMKKSGCHTIIVGLESYDLEGLKKHGRHVTHEKINQLLSKARELNIEVCGDFIIGMPGESSHDIEQTISFAKKSGIQYASFNIATPLPGTSLRKKALEDGRFDEDNSSHIDSLGRKNVLGNGVLQGEEIQKLKSKAVKQFYLRPRFVWERLKSIKSWQHLFIQLNEGLKLLVKQ